MAKNKSEVERNSKENIDGQNVKWHSDLHLLIRKCEMETQNSFHNDP